MKYQGAEWIERQKLGPLSELGQTVADILGYVFRGIYHIEFRYLKEVEWDKLETMTIRLRRGLATHDGNELTELVLLAHLTGVRISINPRSNWTYTLRFHTPNSFLICGGHPTLGEAIDRLPWEWLEEKDE